MYISKVYLTDNFVPDYVKDQFRRRVAGYEVILSEGEDYKEAERLADEKISDYIKRNTVDNTMSGTQVRIVDDPDVIDSDFESFLANLNKFESREEAQGYMEKCGYRFNVQAKQIVESKPFNIL